MGNACQRVRAGAALVALYAGWHLTGGLHGTVFRMHAPPAAAVTAAAVITSQCGALPASAASPSAAPQASPAPAAVAPQLCVSVQAAQDTIARGKTATWTIQVSDQGAPATAVTVTIAAIPAGIAPVFTSSCPAGGGTSACTLGDLGTAVTPSGYQLQAQITTPRDTTAGALSLTATADTSPSMTAAPTAGQATALTSVTPTAKPSHTPGPSPAPATGTPAQPVTTPAARQSPLPVIQLTTAPATGTIPTAAPVTTAVPPVSISTVLPQITPAVTVPAPAASITSSPAANVQAAGGSPAAAASSDSFSLSIGMSAQTAQILGYILLVLVITLIVSKLITSYFTRTRKPAQDQPGPAASTTPTRRRLKLPRLPRPHLSRIHLPRRLRRPGPTRAERAAIRRQNWQHHLQNQQNAKAIGPAPAEAPIPEAAHQAKQPGTGPLTPASAELLPDSPAPQLTQLPDGQNRDNQRSLCAHGQNDSSAASRPPPARA